MLLLGHPSFSLVERLRVWGGSSAPIRNLGRGCIGVFLAPINTCGVMKGGFPRRDE